MLRQQSNCAATGDNALSSSRRQEPGDAALRKWSPGGCRHNRALDPALARNGATAMSMKPEFIRSRDRKHHSSGDACPKWLKNTKFLDQPDRSLRGRWPAGRLRSDRPQDHRRHLRRQPARTAAVPSPVRIRPRLTVRPPTPAVTLPRISWPQGWPASCQVQVAYAIGVAEPDEHHRSHRWAPARSFRTNSSAGSRLAQGLRSASGRHPARCSTCSRPIYSKTAAYGHFGREEPEFTWERTDKAQALRKAAGLA